MGVGGVVGWPSGWWVGLERVCPCEIECVCVCVCVCVCECIFFVRGGVVDTSVRGVNTLRTGKKCCSSLLVASNEQAKWSASSIGCGGDGGHDVE